MQTDDNNPAGEAGNVEPTRMSISDAAGKLESFFDDGADDEPVSQVEDRPAAEDKPSKVEPEDEPIPTYEDDEADEPDVDEGEAPSEDDEDTADDAAEAAAEEPGLDAVVTLPDGSKATVEELIKGNLRDADYRKKTTLLAEERKAVQTEYRTVSERAQNLGKLVTLVDKLVESAVPPPPDPKTRETDPVGYADALAAHEDAKKALDQFRADATPMLGAAQQATQEQIKAHRDEQYRLLVEKDPKWSNPKQIERFIGASMSALTEAGYSPQEIQDALGNDHRLVPVLEGFLNWQHYLKRRSQSVEKSKNKPAPVQRQRNGQFKAGAGVPRTVKRAFQDNPNVNNAAKAIERLI